MTVSYDGRGFAGSQQQGARRTIQSELQRAIATLWRIEEVSTVFAGRTDAGVHAAGQVVSVADGRPDLAECKIVRALNANLPDDLAVQAVERLAGPFHARYDAVWREYRYRLWSGPKQPLVAGLVAQTSRRLDVAAMRTGAVALVGTRDLASFAGGGEGVPWSDRASAPRGTVRTVLVCTIEPGPAWWRPESGAGELIELRIVADGFLPRMVRNIAGALMEIGRGSRPATWIGELLAGRDRRMAGSMAPADGLILWRVGYGDDSYHD
jgi:tRNA pseudouridine38-40 synthase